jgi:hypothetical protein
MCDSCEVLTINGTPCHETGCPDAWRDYTRECKECGSTFTPEFSAQRHCDNYCYAVFSGLTLEEN